MPTAAAALPMAPGRRAGSTPQRVPAPRPGHVDRHAGCGGAGLREASYLPEWLLERRRRIESALATVGATCYPAGVSARRIDHLVQSLGITGLGKSQVCGTAASPRGAGLFRPVDQPRIRVAQYQGYPARGSARRHGRCQRLAWACPALLTLGPRCAQRARHQPNC